MRASELQELEVWKDYEPPFYLEKLYVLEMAELIQTADPDEAEAKLEECWIGTFENDTEMAKHICESFSAEHELEILLDKNPIGVNKRYGKIDYEAFAIDLKAGGDVEVLYNIDDTAITYIWSRY